MISRLHRHSHWIESLNFFVRVTTTVFFCFEIWSDSSASSAGRFDLQLEFHHACHLELPFFLELIYRQGHIRLNGSLHILRAHAQLGGDLHVFIRNPFPPCEVAGEPFPLDGGSGLFVAFRTELIRNGAPEMLLDFIFVPCYSVERKLPGYASEAMKLNCYGEEGYSDYLNNDTDGSPGQAPAVKPSSLTDLSCVEHVRPHSKTEVHPEAERIIRYNYQYHRCHFNRKTSRKM